LFIDLLHGAHVVDEIVFNVQGDKEQSFNWNECGFRLYVPEGALLPTETCPVAVKALIAGRFILPKYTELVSAFYAISASRKFHKEVKTELQHCLLLESKKQTESLHFIKAHQTHPGMPYQFKLQPGGEFMVNTRYAALWQSEFSIVAIVRTQTFSVDELGSDNEVADNEGLDDEESENGSENSAEDQTQEDDQKTDGSNNAEPHSYDELHIIRSNSQVGHSEGDVNQSIKTQQTDPLAVTLESKNTQTEWHCCLEIYKN